MSDRLQEKVVLVTGGGSGIGKAIALRCAEEGARVAVCGRTQSKLEATSAQIHGEAPLVAVDRRVQEGGGRIGAGEQGRRVARDLSPRMLDLDHFGAEVAEHAAAHRAGPY